jgi:putative sigma-54 modulation protein
MQITVSVRHGDMSEATIEKIRSKFEKLNHLFERLTSVDITVDLEKADNPKIDVHVSAEHKSDFVASYTSGVPSTASDLYKTGDLFGNIDHALHKIEQQLRKYKERIQNHHRGSEKSDGEEE